MGMRLHYSPASPFARKVRITLHELGRTSEVEAISAATSPTGTGSSPVPGNPLGKIPTLERDSGPALYDSRVICRYLAEGTALYPKGDALWEMLTLEALGDGISDAAISITYEMRYRSDELQNKDWIEGQWQKVSRALDALENLWMAHLQAPLDMGQISVGAALGYLHLRHEHRNWRQGRPQLSAWYDRISARPSFADTAAS